MPPSPTRGAATCLGPSNACSAGEATTVARKRRQPRPWIWTSALMEPRRPTRCGAPAGAPHLVGRLGSINALVQIQGLGCRRFLATVVASPALHAFDGPRHVAAPLVGDGGIGGAVHTHVGDRFAGLTPRRVQKTTARHVHHAGHLRRSIASQALHHEAAVRQTHGVHSLGVDVETLHGFGDQGTQIAQIIHRTAVKVAARGCTRVLQLSRQYGG